MELNQSIGQPSVFARLMGSFLAALPRRTDASIKTSAALFTHHKTEEEAIRQYD